MARRHLRMWQLWINLSVVRVGQVELVGRLMGALASRGSGAAREREAAELLALSLGSDALLSAGDLPVYTGCLRATLGACRSLRPSAVASLLRCFDLGGFSAALLLPQGGPASGQVLA